MDLIVSGFNNTDIANELSISKETIKTHKRNIKIKLKIKSNSEIIDYANKYLI
ncbi:MAG TPA: response regulator transcription factor [Campylobacterales bacterium]|nr:response regulator transcription factor [Campylobacterales bacterium]